MPYAIIDSHQHFWKYEPVRDSWITEEMRLLRRDFLPFNLEPLLKENNVTGTVLIQSDASEPGNLILLEHAGACPFVKGLVCWFDPRKADAEQRLAYYRQFPQVKGFRFLLQDEQKRDLLLDEAFQNGIGLLNSFGFSFDLLIRPDQLVFTKKLVQLFPDQRFVIDHLAKPPIGNKNIGEWKTAIQHFASFENVYCKVSGMFTEANWTDWNKEDFRPYTDVVVETFGMKRLMFGSDWPVCLLAAEYNEVMQMAKDYFKTFTLTEQADFFAGNAGRFYQLT